MSTLQVDKGFRMRVGLGRGSGSPCPGHLAGVTPRESPRQSGLRAAALKEETGLAYEPLLDALDLMARRLQQAGELQASV